MLDTLKSLKAGTLTRTVQNDADATFAPMTDKDLSRLDFSQSAQTVHDTIRAVTGFAFRDGGRLKIYRTKMTDKTSSLIPGTLFTDDGALFVQCEDRPLRITELQPDGGKRVKASDFLNGHPVKPGTVLTRE
jgi:methionyl-tRNA formyltransferase